MDAFGDDGDDRDRGDDVWSGSGNVPVLVPVPVPREVKAAAAEAQVPMNAEVAAFAAAHPDRVGPLVELHRQALVFLDAG
ncbi:hypothetical protein [Nonomuraea sp. NPDC005501]|uniref:hypothetical protein n=1 Tax=Nonomuraea sp. NPDC005501 TaxID=3156884 RepID=UPI0033A1CDF1